MEAKEGEKRSGQERKPLKGWLKKKGEDMLHGWKKRYFLQEENKLFYFASEETQPIGLIDLARVTEVNQVNRTQINLVTPERTYQMQVIPNKGPTKRQALYNKLSSWYYQEPGTAEAALGSHPGADFADSAQQVLSASTQGSAPERSESAQSTPTSTPITPRKADDEFYYWYNGLSAWVAYYTSTQGALELAQDRASQPRASEVDNHKDAPATVSPREFSSASSSSSSSSSVTDASQPTGVSQSSPASTATAASASAPSLAAAPVEDAPGGFSRPTSPSPSGQVPASASSSPVSSATATPVQAQTPPESVVPAAASSGASSRTGTSTTTAESGETEGPEPRTRILNDLAPAVAVVAIAVLLLPYWFLVGLLGGLGLSVGLLYYLVITFLAVRSGQAPAPTAATVDLGGADDTSAPISSSSSATSSSLHAHSHMEPCHWFNIILGKVYLEHVTNKTFVAERIQKIQLLLDKAKRPGFIGAITLQSIDFGSNTFQITDGIKLLDGQAPGEHRASFHIMYRGDSPMRFTITTMVYINWPTEHFAAVPVTLTINMEYMAGPCVFIVPAGADPVCQFAFTGPPAAKFTVSSLVGNRAKVKNIPKLSQFLVGRLHKFVNRDLVMPLGVCFHLPIKGARQLRILLIRKYNEEVEAQMQKDPGNAHTMQALNTETKHTHTSLTNSGQAAAKPGAPAAPAAAARHVHVSASLPPTPAQHKKDEEPEEPPRQRRQFAAPLDDLTDLPGMLSAPPRRSLERATAARSRSHNSIATLLQEAGTPSLSGSFSRPAEARGGSKQEASNSSESPLLTPLETPTQTPPETPRDDLASPLSSSPPSILTVTEAHVRLGEPHAGTVESGPHELSLTSSSSEHSHEAEVESEPEGQEHDHEHLAPGQEAPGFLSKLHRRLSWKGKQHAGEHAHGALPLPPLPAAHAPLTPAATTSSSSLPSVGSAQTPAPAESTHVPTANGAPTHT